MAICQSCSAEVEEQDLYEVNGLRVCEDCKISHLGRVPRPCCGEK